MALYAEESIKEGEERIFSLEYPTVNIEKSAVSSEKKLCCKLRKHPLEVQSPVLQGSSWLSE